MDKNFSFFSESPEELKNIFESGRKYRQEIYDQTFQSDLNKFQENLQNVITKEVEKNSHRSERHIKRNYTENFPTFTNNNKNKITSQRRGKYNFHKSPSKDFPTKLKDSSKKVLFNSFFNNNEIVAEKKIHSFKPKNENNLQFSNFLQNNLNNNFPSKFNEFEDIERLSSNIDQINDKVLEVKNSKLLYSSVLKFPENENSCKDKILPKVEENKISTNRISSNKKTLIEKIEISSSSNMEKLLKKIEENQIKITAEITKNDFKNLPRIVSGENFNRKIEDDKIGLQLSDLGDENFDDGQILDFDVLENIYLEEFDLKFF